MSELIQLGRKPQERPIEEFVVLSGKGGTGKTSFTAALIVARQQVVAADCDVEAANLAVLFPGAEQQADSFVSGRKATLVPDLCTACEACVDACRFDALSMAGGEKALAGAPVVIDEAACEGCGACALVCPVDAFTFTSVRAGRWAVRPLPFGGSLVHAELEPGEDRSGRLVSHVRTQARHVAEALGLSSVIIDGPPGIGCPVHAALSGVRAAMVVTEPTRAAISDLDRILSTAAHFRVPVGVVINKWDLAKEQATEVEQACAERGVPIIGRVPFDRAIPEALGRGEVPSRACPALDETARDVWKRLEDVASLSVPCAAWAGTGSVAKR